MKKSHLILFHAIVLFALQIKAQPENFNLSDYKLPVIERKLLEIDFNLDGNNSRFGYPETFAFSDRSQNSFQNNISARYSSFLNNETTQRNYHITGGMSYSFRNNKQDSELVNKFAGFSPNFSTNLVNRKYDASNRFIEFGLLSRGQLSLSSAFNTGEIINENNNTSSNFNASVPLKIGVGRIEPVHDARQAIYIIQELAAIERLSAPQTDDEIIRFASLISKQRNKRFFDSRIKTIEDLEVIDAWLQENGYVTVSDASYFATLADYWAFGNAPLRQSGQRVSLALIPNYSYGYYKHNIIQPTESENGNKTNSWAFYSGVEYVYEKPVSLTWQRSLSAYAYYGWASENRNFITSDFEIRSRYSNIMFGASPSLGYYPNTRTSATATLRMQYLNFFDQSNEEKDILSKEGSGLGIGTSVGINYYFSPQLRLNIFHNISYALQNTDESFSINFNFHPGTSAYQNFPGGILDHFSYDKSFYHSFGISLLYSIF